MIPLPRPACSPARRWSPVARWAAALGVGLGVVIALAAAVAYFRIAASPLAVPGLTERIAGSIAARIGPGWRVELQRSAVALDEEGNLAVRAVGLDIRNPEGALVVRAPFALVGVDPLSLLGGGVQPRSIDFRDLQLRATVNRDGSLAFATSPDMAPTVVAPAPRASPKGDLGPDPGVTPVSGAVASLFGAVLEPSGIVGALDRARLTNARLSLVDEEGRERALYTRMDARFERRPSGVSHFEMHLEGANGPWQLSGDLRDSGGDNGRSGTIALAGVPVQDALLLSGLSRVPATTDLRISARAEASLRQGRLERLEGRAETSSGTIVLDDKDFSPIPVERVGADVSWNEDARSLAIQNAAFEAGETRIPLNGTLSLAPSGPDAAPWRLDLDSRGGRLNGAAAGDAPIALDRIEVRLAGLPTGARIDTVSMTGPMLNAALQGTVGTEADRGGFTVRLTGSETEGRTALRLWPEGIAKSAREYLLRNLPGAVAESVAMTYALGAPELDVALRGGLIPDGALRIDFRVREGELVAAEGLPALTGGAVQGVVTGRSTTIRQSAGEVRMPDGRGLAMEAGLFTAVVTAPKKASGKVAFRLVGGADALASLLQTPALRPIAGVDLNPASIRGRADLKVDFPLPFDTPPEALKDLALTVAGTAADVAIEKAFGRDRLESGQLSIGYDAGTLAVKGEARIAGAPATIDIRHGGAGAGEAVIAMILDEQARARKGLSFGSQLTGPLPLRITMPLGAPGPKGARGGIRIEADLGKAGIDNLVPGWTKPAGRAGKLAFTLHEGTEVRDLVLDSGSVTARGSAAFTHEGTLERVELTSFKLSPGDDMRVQAERSGPGYKVHVRGAVADARPLLRGLTGGGVGGGRERDPPAREVELDFSVNILTGFNDEALTNAAIKASLHGRTIRQLSLQGRFRSAAVTAQVLRKDRGGPALTVTSEDAGATLRFLDIYRRMIGGQLAFAANLGETPQTGVVTIDTFGLRNEPALRNIAQQSQAALPDERATGAHISRLDSGEVAFTRLKANLSRSGTRVDFSDAVIWGMQVGFTLGGWVDVARDRTDVAGTFVPAYGLNNVFAQVPLFGPLLGGGQHEGLFAINFRVSGLLSAPTLTVNPLSAVAPGFLRKIFGFIPQGGDVPTGSAPRAPSAPTSRR